MEFSIATLLSHLSEDKLVAPKVLEKKLDCTDRESNQKLQIALDALQRIGIIVKERGKYRRVADEELVEARLRCSSKGFCFAIQEDESSEDIYIRESNLSSAWNGDRVLVKTIKEASRRRSPEGAVRVILERSNPSLLAQVKRREDGSFRAVPLDDRLLFELELRHNSETLLEAATDHLVHVEVLRYPLGETPPLGKVTRVLGSDAEEAADTDIVICKHDLPRTFDETVVEAADRLFEEIPNHELRQRQDLRELFTLTLEDGEGTEAKGDPFVETAYSLEKEENGNWRFGIHIADVAHFIEPESLLDETARKRGTAIYLEDMVLPLFPKEVQECCALVAEKDRLAVSLFLSIDSLGTVQEFEWMPSVVRVDRALSYQEAQSLLGRGGTMEGEDAIAAQMLNHLFFTLSSAVKAQRMQRGAFEIELAEAQTPFKDEGRLGAIAVSSTLPVRSLLTELVVLAGRAMAAHLQALALPTLFRVQSPPDWTELEDLLKLAENLELELEVETDEIHPQDYQNFSQQFVKTASPRVLFFLLQSTLKPCRYSTKPGAHFGLAHPSGGYTPCVSPGQRYGDLVVQRILKQVFEEGRDRRHSRAKEGVNLGSSTCHGKINWNVLPTEYTRDLEAEIAILVGHLNEREKVAREAESDLKGLKKAEKMKERTGQIFKGLITGVQTYGFFVEIEDLLVEGLVHVSSLKDDWYEYRARHACLVGRKNRIAYRLGSHVEVKVKSVDYYRQQIDLVTVNGATPANDNDFEEN